MGLVADATEKQAVSRLDLKEIHPDPRGPWLRLRSSERAIAEDLRLHLRICTVGGWVTWKGPAMGSARGRSARGSGRLAYVAS
jgi:hypothetical protein